MPRQASRSCRQPRRAGSFTPHPSGCRPVGTRALLRRSPWRAPTSSCRRQVSRRRAGRAGGRQTPAMAPSTGSGSTSDSFGVGTTAQHVGGRRHVRRTGRGTRRSPPHRRSTVDRRTNVPDACEGPSASAAMKLDHSHRLETNPEDGNFYDERHDSARIRGPLPLETQARA